jgi:hypothetical protein
VLRPGVAASKVAARQSISGRGTIDKRLGRVPHLFVELFMTADKRRTESTRCAWRNLKVQDRQFVRKWKKFEGFLKDMGDRPDGLVLVARDPQKRWSKANCYWGPRYKAFVYHSRARIITWNGISTSIGEWARRLKIRPNTIVTRLHRGWDVERALTAK